MIDAGHGGKDPGNLGTGRYKAKEKDISLEVALMVGSYIQTQFPEIKVIYTRNTDVFIGLDERADIANKADADIFISIHCNAFKNPESSGVETYALGLHRNQENLEVAMKENSAIYMEDDYKVKYEGFDPNSPESIIALTIMQSAYLQQSLAISSYIQEQFKTRVGRKDRGVKQAGFLVLRKTTMPSILIELGFLTNKAEEDFLNTDEGKSYMASAIFRGFKEYKDMVEDPLPEGAVQSKPAIETTTDNEAAKAELEKAKLKEAEERKVEEARKAEEARKMAEAKKAEETRKLAEAKKEEEARKAEEGKQAEEARKLAEAKKAEEARKAAEAKQKEAELAKLAALKAKNDSIANVQEQARMKAQRDSMELKRAQLLAEKEKREADMANSANEEEARMKARLDSLERVKQAKVAEFERQKKELEEKQELEFARKKAEDEAAVIAKEEALKKELETKAEAKEWLQEIKDVKQEELEEAKRKTEVDEEKARLEAIRKQKEEELEAARSAEALRSAQEDSTALATDRMIAEQARIDSVAKVREAEAELARRDSLNRAKLEEAKAREATKAKQAAEADRPVTIDTQKAATPEEAELLFLQLRKKQLEQRIAELKNQNVSSATKASLEKRAESQPAERFDATLIKVDDAPSRAGVVFKVQIATSPSALSKDDLMLKGQAAWQYKQDGLYKYAVGDTQDFEEITKLQAKLRSLGFQGAFVVAFKDGERIKVSDARELIK